MTKTTQPAAMCARARRAAELCLDRTGLERLFVINNKERKAIKCTQNNLNRGGEAFCLGSVAAFFQIKPADKTSQARGNHHEN